MVMRHLRRRNSGMRIFFIILAVLIIFGLVGSTLIGVAFF